MNWDIIIYILSGIILIIGFVGCIVPVIPGPPIAFCGILLSRFASSEHPFSNRFLIIFAIVVVIVTILDYVVPAWGTKTMGGTKRGTRGATLGTIIGIFFGPWGIILGPFIGAFLGEVTRKGTKFGKALKSGIGSLLGFLTGTLLKMISVAFMIWFFFSKAIF